MLDVHLGKVTALGVLCCFALFVCLTLLASFFLPSHLSFKNMYMCYSAGSDGGPGTLLSTQLTDKQKFLTFSYSKVHCVYIHCRCVNVVIRYIREPQLPMLRTVREVEMVLNELVDAFQVVLLNSL